MTERTSRLAVKAVEEASLHADWFFRGELVNGKKGIDEVGTGRLIALQIKGGPSYFSRPSPNGWGFPFKARKAQLWLGHALPVLVVLVDLGSGEMCWQRVSAATVVKTGKNYKIEVPRSQTVSAAGAEWLGMGSRARAPAGSGFGDSLPTG